MRLVVYAGDCDGSCWSFWLSLLVVLLVVLVVFFVLILVSAVCGTSAQPKAYRALAEQARGAGLTLLEWGKDARCRYLTLARNTGQGNDLREETDVVCANAALVVCVGCAEGRNARQELSLLRCATGPPPGHLRTFLKKLFYRPSVRHRQKLG